MSFGGRFLVRAVSAISYALLFASAVTALASDVPWLRWAGAFLAAFLLDRVLHAHGGDVPIYEMSKKGRVNLAHFSAPAALHVFERAYERSGIRGTDLHLECLRELVRGKEIREGLTRLDVNPEEFDRKLEDFLSRSAEEKAPSSSEERRAILEVLAFGAFAEARGLKRHFILPADVFAALARVSGGLTARIFSVFDIEPGDLGRALLFSTTKRGFSFLRRVPSSLGGFFFEADRGPRHRVINRAWTSRPTPTLDRYGADFTDFARSERIGFLVGHEKEYARLTETLSRGIKPNALLIGEPGIGKETIVGHLAYELIKDRVPSGLFDRRLVALDLARLVAGATPEELQKRLERIVAEIVTAGNVILYIPEIHNLVKTSGTAYLSAADALLPIVMNDAFPVIGTTYPREYKEFIEPRSDFAGAFEAIRMQEISEPEAQTLLVYDGVLLEGATKRMITFGAVKTAVRLAKKYFRDTPLPGSAEELLKSAIALAERREEKIITPAFVIAAAEEKVNIPIHEADGREADRLLNLESLIHERLVDQEEAVRAVADALREYRSGLSRKGGPIASFLFVGPTGVGKTELAKTLAAIQFGSEDAMIRFDMTEYQDKQSFYRFIGSPDGKVSGALTDAVLEKPYSIILLDEFEKAFPDILNLFLQVLDDGRLTNSLGRVVGFEHAIVIATSNAHSDIINRSLAEGQTMLQIADYVRRKLVDVFKPELLNRFSRIVIFKDLAFKDVEKIAEIQLRGLAQLAEDKGITLSFDPQVVKKIAKLGYDPAFGARPLRRVIDERIRSNLAEYLLRKKAGRGTTLRVVLEGEEAFAFQEE